MPSGKRSYTLIKMLSGQLLACGAFRDLNAQFVAAAGSAASDDYVPVEIEVVRNWAEYRSGNELFGRVVFVGGEPVVETLILNVAAVQSLAPAEIG
jgi:hypothetical protein